MQRITIKHLERLCEQLNKVTNSPMVPYAKDETAGRYVAQIGNFHISQAYGGYCLHRMHNEGGGVSTPLSGGHGPARDLYNEMHAFLRGLEFAQYEKN